MKKLAFLFIALFCAATSVSAQHKQRVAVLPSVGDLDPQRLILLTDRVREIATRHLPMDNFNILKLDVITKMIGEEELYRSCKEGVCIGDLARKTNANYGARCDVVKLDNSLVLKFELYSVDEDAIFETFTDYGVKDFHGMLAVLEARLPATFQKIVYKMVYDKALADAKDKAAEQQRREAAPAPVPAAPDKDKSGEQRQAEPDTAAPLADFRDENAGMDMVFVKGGAFMMGCSDNRGCESAEKPPHWVTLGDFYIGKYEVTQKQWVQVMGGNPSHFNSGDNLPVENVSWYDIQIFISRLNSITGKKYRLPTEAEWEYAARGGTGSGYRFSGGDTIGDVGWYWYRGGGTNPVGGKRPNEIGIYDMTGNVAEWVSDYYDYGIYAFSNGTANPKGPASGVYKAVRGGSYAHSPAKCRVSYRDSEKPDARKSSVGFRLALDAREAGSVVNYTQLEGDAAKKQISRSRIRRPPDFYFAPKFMLGLGEFLVAPGGNVEIGWTFSNRMLFGIDFGLGVGGGGWDDGGGMVGIGLSLGRVHDLPVPQMQLAYGGSVGFWEAYAYSETKYDNGSHYYDHRGIWNFLAPFIRLRWKFIELSYRGLLGTYYRYEEIPRYISYGNYYGYDENYDEGFGWNNHQIMLGLYFGGR